MGDDRVSSGTHNDAHAVLSAADVLCLLQTEENQRERESDELGAQTGILVSLKFLLRGEDSDRLGT